MNPSSSSLTRQLSACLDEMLGLDPHGLDDAEAAAMVRALSTAETRLRAYRLGVLDAAEQAGTAQRSGAASTAAWASSLTNGDPRTAHQEVRLGRQLAGLRPTSDAMREGRLGADHAAIITETMDRLPDHLSGEERALIEKHLLVKAEQVTPHRLRRIARRALEALEPPAEVVDAEEDDALGDEEARARAAPRLTLHDNGDGTVTGRFTVPVLQGRILQKVLEAMTAPRRARLGASEAQAGPAPRTDWAHARGLAFCELIEHLPTDHLHSRTAANLVVKLDLQALRDGLSAAGLDTGDVISAGAARRLACNAGLIPAVLGGAGQPLDLGRMRRLFTETQRTALSLRHDTCAAEGCQRPFAWCELHHLDMWSRGGRTDLRLAVPLCGFHHQRIHDRAFAHTRAADGTLRFTRRT